MYGRIMKALAAAAALFAAAAMTAGAGHAQNPSVVIGQGGQGRVMPVEQMRAALETSKDQWVAFRNYNGKQWVYFTGLVTWHCGLKEIRYSVNARDLAERFPVPECNPQVPFNIDPVKDRIYLNFPLGGAQTVTVQLVFIDGVESPVRTYGPCNVEGDTTCGVPVE